MTHLCGIPLKRAQNSVSKSEKKILIFYIGSTVINTVLPELVKVFSSVSDIIRSVLGLLEYFKRVLEHGITTQTKLI